jgi:hypothetical protein
VAANHLPARPANRVSKAFGAIRPACNRIVTAARDDHNRCRAAKRLEHFEANPSPIPRQIGLMTVSGGTVRAA